MMETCTSSVANSACCKTELISTTVTIFFHPRFVLLCSVWRLQCKYDFCWVCLEPWKKHSTATGGYFRCNRYEVVRKVEEQQDLLKTEVLFCVSQFYCLALANR